MGKLQKNQSGFSAIEGLLILVVVGIIGFTGWYVWHAKSNTDKALTVSNSDTPIVKKKAVQATTPAQPADPTVGWTAYTNSSEKFSLKHPESWANLPDCSSGFAFWADAKSVPTSGCHSENVTQISVSSMNGDQSAYGLNNGWKDVQTKKVTVDGVGGQRQEGVASGQDMGVGALEDGTVKVRYIFYTNGKTYFADYIQDKSWPNATDDFDLMVTKTLKFN